MRDRWTRASVLLRLGLAPDYVPATMAEAKGIYERTVDLLRSDDTVSGYQEVYAVGSKWQAKPYTAPGKQRNLGSFTSASEGRSSAVGPILPWRRARASVTEATCQAWRGPQATPEQGLSNQEAKRRPSFAPVGDVGGSGIGEQWRAAS